MIPQKPLADFSRSEISWLIDEYVFVERDRGLLKRRWLDGIRFAVLAEEFDLSERQVKNIIRKAGDQVFRHLDKIRLH